MSLESDYTDLDKLRITIESLSTYHHIEIAKILLNNNIKVSENNNGIFVNLSNISSSIINEIKEYIKFINSQEYHINIDEIKKNNLENIYFKKTETETRKDNCINLEK